MQETAPAKRKAKAKAKGKGRKPARKATNGGSDSRVRAPGETGLRIELMALNELADMRWAGNPKEHDLPGIKAAITGFGFVAPLAMDEGTGRLVAGHGRLQALLELKADGAELPKRVGIADDGEWLAPVLRGVEFSSESEAEAYLVADNRLTERGGWRDDDLAAVLTRLQRDEPDLAKLTGFSEADLLRLLADPGNAGVGPGPVTVPLASRFLVPPFTVLDARQGYWLERKRQWLAIGIRSHLGRKSALISGEGRNAYRSKVTKAADGTLRYDGEPSLKGGLVYGMSPGAYDGGRAGASAEANASGTSVFDPVLAEIALRWFAPAGGRVLDPFAGGSVRGVVSGALGFRYVGVDLARDQIVENRKQAKVIGASLKAQKAPWVQPTWHEGDSRDLDRLLEPGWEADLVLTCPPYFDLESYSEDARDLSTLATEDFLAQYKQIMTGALRRLKANRFAFIVVGNARDGTGALRDLCGPTIDACRDAGAALWNDGILVTPLATLPLRVGKQFPIGRKMGRTHQYVLVFYKGDPDRLAAEFGEIAMPEEVLAAATEPEPEG